MKKFIITYLITIGGLTAIAQNGDLEETDTIPFSRVQLESVLLDSTSMFGEHYYHLSANLYVGGEGYGSNDFSEIVYKDKTGKLRMFTLDFNIVDEGEWINLDKKGENEMVLFGKHKSYGSGGGSGDEVMLIINIDNEPVIVFQAGVSCFVESFGDKNNGGEGSYVESFKRKIVIKNKKLIVKPHEVYNLDCFSFRYDKIKPGKYKFKNGRFKKI